MYSSLQILADFMVLIAASRVWQTSWYVQQQLQDTSSLHGYNRQRQPKIGKFEQQQLPGTGSFHVLYVHVKQLLQDINIWRVH
jgi:hypothetical protein